MRGESPIGDQVVGVQKKTRRMDKQLRF